MAVDVADPETRALIELAQKLVPASLGAVEYWEQRVDWSEGDLAIEVRSWTPRVNVVSRALTAVDEHWRLATAILDTEITAESTGLRLRDLIDGASGLTVINAVQGSLLARLRDEYGKHPLRTLTVIAALIGAGGTAGEVVVHAAEVVLDRVGGDGEGGDLSADVELSEDTREVLRQVPALPPGTETTIVLRVVTPDADASATVQIRRAPQSAPMQPHEQAPPATPQTANRPSPPSLPSQDAHSEAIMALVQPSPGPKPTPQPFFVVKSPGGPRIAFRAEFWSQARAAAEHLLVALREGRAADVAGSRGRFGAGRVTATAATEEDARALVSELREISLTRVDRTDTAGYSRGLDLSEPLPVPLNVIVRGPAQGLLLFQATAQATVEAVQNVLSRSSSNVRYARVVGRTSSDDPIVEVVPDESGNDVLRRALLSAGAEQVESFE